MNKPRLVLVIVVLSVMLASMSTVPVAAAYVSTTAESFQRQYEPGTNNHTYAYVEPSRIPYNSRTWLHATGVGTNMRSYRYSNAGWDLVTSAYSGDEDQLFLWAQHSSYPGNSFSNTTMLPTFYDVIGSANEPTGINTTVIRYSFQLTMNTVNTVVLNPDVATYGALAIGTEEFVHLVVSSRLDAVTWAVVVYDSRGREMANVESAEGDTIVIPFRPSGPGTYTVLIETDTSAQGLVLFDINPVAVNPILLGDGQLVQGVLAGSELVVESDGSVVHKEKIPSTVTYRCQSDVVSSISYSFNYPELSVPLVPTYPVSIAVESDAFTQYYDIGRRYRWSASTPQTGVYHYRSFRGESYYVTVTGADNVEYAILNKAVPTGDLPVNTEFQVRNFDGYSRRMTYELNLNEDHIMNVNGTVPSGTITWRVWTVYDNKMHILRTLSFSATMPSAPLYYFPAGKYVVEVEMSSGAMGKFEFNIGPIVSDSSAVIPRIGGFLVSSHAMRYYNMTFRLLNLDNITVNTRVEVWDRYSIQQSSVVVNLANKWNGTHWFPHETYLNYTEIVTNNRLTEGYFIVAVCTNSATDNTGSGVPRPDYPVRYNLTVYDHETFYYNDIAELTGGASAPLEYNFTTSLTQATERYSLRLNVPKGVWFNVTVIASSASAFSAELLHRWQQRTHRVPWNRLNDNLVGNIGTQLSFQFGSISSSLTLAVQLTRTAGVAGYLYIRIVPLKTDQFEVPPPLTPPQPGPLDILGPYLIPIGVGAAAIVIVTVVYFKKFKK